MTADNPAPSSVGATVLMVTIPEVESAVGRWRQRFDSSAPWGVPAHVSVLYPFLDSERIIKDTLDDLQDLFASRHVFDVTFTDFRRFPGVLYLAPTPDDHLRDLTVAVWERWPEAPPYNGQFDDVIPHLTVADGVDSETMDMIELDVRAALPIAARVTSVQLHVFDGNRWRPRAEFPLSG